MTGILMNTLVRVSADLSSIGAAKCAPGSKPLVEQIAHRPFAQFSNVIRALGIASAANFIQGFALYGSVYLSFASVSYDRAGL